MNAEDFELEVTKGKRTLLILDDLVVDVTSFAGSHPGGRFVLEKNNGKDISKYFHGGYSFEPLQGSTNHRHSNYARTIVNSLIVARYVSKKESVVASIADSATTSQQYDSIKTFKLQVIRGEEQEFKRLIHNFYPDFVAMGKHYLV